MNLGWLAALGVCLLLMGVCTLVYDNIRRKNDNSPFPFPDDATNRLDDTAQQLLEPVATHRQTPSIAMRLAAIVAIGRWPTSVGRSNRSFPQRADFLSRVLLAIPRRSVIVIVIMSLLLTGMSLAVLVAGAGSPAAPPGSVVLAISPFAQGPAAIQAQNDLANYIAESAGKSGLSALLVRTAKYIPVSPPDAELERGKLSADALIWGKVDDSGTFTVTITLAPDYAAGTRPWQKLADPDLRAMTLPDAASLVFPSGAATDPLVPLSLGMANFKLGNFRAAADAAWGAQETMNQSGVRGQFARLFEAESRLAAGSFKESVAASSEVANDPMLTDQGVLTRALAEFYLNDLSDALDHCSAVIADRNAGNSLLSQAYLTRARARYGGGDLAQAMDDLDEASRLNPADLRVHLERAEVLYRQTRPSEAATELNSVLKAEPDAAPAYRLMGLVRLMLGQPEDALASLGSAESLFKGWVGVLKNEEAQANAAGDTARSGAATDGIVRLNKDLAGVELYQGMAWADVARNEPKESFLGSLWRGIRGEPATWERALAKMQEAARLDPTRPDVPLQLGSLYAQQGDYDSATTNLNQALALDPAAPEPFMALASLQQAQGKSKEAIAALSGLLSHSPRYYPAYEKIADLDDSLGDKASTEATLKQGIAVVPQTSSDHMWRGKFLRRLSQNAEAEQELRIAGLDPALWEAHLLLGNLLQQEGRGPDALAEFDAVLSSQPNNETALLQAGKLLVLAGSLDDAQKLFERLTAVSPANLDGHLALLQLLVSRGNVDQAISEGRQAVTLDGSRSDAHYFLGLAYESGYRWPEAAAEYATAGQRDPHNYVAFLGLAKAYFLEDHYADGLAAADSAIALRGDQSPPYRWKAEAQLALGNVDGALSTLGSRPDAAGGDADSLALIARAYAAKGDFSSAVAYAERATQAAPNNPAGQLAMGEVQLQQGKPQDALQAYGSVLDLGDAHTQAKAMTGEARAYGQLGDQQKALQLLAGALQRDPTVAEPFLYEGNVYAAGGYPDQAFEGYRRAVALRPNWPVALYYLGKTYLQRKDLANAQAAFSKAATYSPNMVEAWYGLGIAQRGEGNSNDAITSLAKATQLNSDYAEAWLYLGLTYEEVGRRSEASDAFLHASASASNNDIKSQAEQGLARVR